MNNRPQLINLALAIMLLISALGYIPTPVQAAPGGLVISQVYGGGGNSGAPYTHDFIEIFNSGNTPISLDGLSLQYASATGTGNFGANAGQLTELPDFMLQPGQYFLVQQAAGTTGDGVPLPTPDHVDTTPINMSAVSGKVVLVTGTTSLGCNGGSTPCDADQLARIIDLVGYGTANFYEGTGAAPTLNNTTAAFRADGGCTDTDDNAADFTAGAPAPRNSVSPTNVCGLPISILRLSQVYGGGGNTGAPYTHDFIEIFNSGNTPVALDGLSLQYASATGTGNFGATATQLTELPDFMLQPGQYFLVQQAGGTNGVPLPTPDYIDPTPIAMAAGSGKVALVTGTSSLGCNGGSTPCDADQLARIIDLVGYGSANFYEGTGAAPTLSNTTAAFRAGGGCIDTDDNAADFTAASPAPRNSASPVNICSLDPPPYVINTVPANNALEVPLDSSIEITFSESVSVTDPWFEIDCSLSGMHSASVISENPIFTIDPDMDFLGAETCSVTIYADKVSDEGTPPKNMASDYSFSFNTIETCGDYYTPIYDIQGDGMVTPLFGQIVSTEGIVVGDFQVGKGGFFIQDPVGDGDESTSDGIFVYAPSSMEVSVGDHVRVRGTATEYYDLTQIGSVQQVWLCATGLDLPDPVELTLPVESVYDFEPYEGMLVTFPQALVISEYYNFGRYGEIVLTSERQITPTAMYAPGPDAIEAAQAYLLDRITLDDGRNVQNPDPAIHPNGLEFNLDNLFRGGDLVTNVTGVMDYGFGLYRIQPTQGADYTPTNHRTESPEIEDGDIKIASFNVYNYFTTLDNQGKICGPSGDMECRGADNAEELERQRAKILAALSVIDADVVGLMEVENDRPGPDPDYAVADLVAGLNDMVGEGMYDYIATGAIGTDAIKGALIYKPAGVTPVGEYAILDSTYDPDFLDDYNRPVLAQTFMDNLSGELFIVAVNHLKSKGSSCDAVGDPDQGDGAGNCNLTRDKAARVQVEWLATDPTGMGVDYFLIIGDLNSYDKEDPINTIKAGADGIPGTEDDYLDMIYEILGEEAYSYVFDGQIGYLDYIMVSASLAEFVTDLAIWHINADEASLIDYDTTFKKPAQAAIYAPDAYRSSDHDPVIITLTFDYELVAVDIRPTSCPNPFNVRDRGVLPVAILGTESFDVTQIDLSTIRLENVAALRWNYEDVAAPFEPYIGKACAFDCTTDGPDGYMDIILHFSNQAMVAALGDIADGDVLVLRLTGNLLAEYGGTPIIGEDVIFVIKK